MDVIQTDKPYLHTRSKITQIIAKFWDKTSDGWRMVWGPHIHHGYYENNATTVTPLQAQEKLIDNLAALLDIQPGSTLFDIGCGMGGSSIYLAKKYHVQTHGITLSQRQLDIANQDAAQQQLKQVTFAIEDAQSLASIPDNTFDIIWSLESCEQFYDKDLFVQQAYRVLKPNGKMMLATWCSDQELYQGKLANKYKKLCLAFDLPYMPTIPYYQKILTSRGFELLNTMDWSAYTEKSWQIGLSLLKQFSFLQLLKMAGWRGYRFVQQLKLMRDAVQEKRVRYGVFLLEKRHN